MKLTLSSGMILSMASSFMLSTRNCVVAFNNNAALVGLSKNRPFLQHHQLSTKSQHGGSIFSFLSSTQKEMEEEVDPGVVEGTDLRVLKYPHPSLRAENTIITDEELGQFVFVLFIYIYRYHFPHIVVNFYGFFNTPKMNNIRTPQLLEK